MITHAAANLVGIRMFPPLNFGTVVYLLFVGAGFFFPFATLAKRSPKLAWARTALWLLAPPLVTMEFLGPELRYNSLHLGSHVYRCAWVVSYLCGGASLTLIVLLAVSAEFYGFFSRSKPNATQPLS